MYNEKKTLKDNVKKQDNYVKYIYIIIRYWMLA